MILVACSIIKNDQDQFLVCQRHPDKHLGGYWEFPGGKIEPNESAHTAIVREIKEELDICVEPISDMNPVIWDYENLSIKLYPIHCQITHGTIKLNEHSQYEWLSSSQFQDYQWAPADIPILDQLSPNWRPES